MYQLLWENMEHLKNTKVKDRIEQSFHSQKNKNKKKLALEIIRISETNAHKQHEKKLEGKKQKIRLGNEIVMPDCTKLLLKCELQQKMKQKNNDINTLIVHVKWLDFFLDGSRFLSFRFTIFLNFFFFVRRARVLYI